MNLKDYLLIDAQVAGALREGRPVAALATSLFSHGEAYPENLAFAHAFAQAVRDAGAVPAPIAVVDGALHVGLSEPALERLCREPGVARVSRAALPVTMATGGTGTTTVASAMIACSLAGIPVLASDGIGGVLVRPGQAPCVSADLQELCRSSVGVVCAGVNLGLACESAVAYLETLGVPVLGLGTAQFPAYFFRESGCSVLAAQDERQAAHILKIKWDLGLAGGVLIANPPDAPPDGALLHAAVMSAAREDAYGPLRTPHLLAHIARETGGASWSAIRRIACGNARAAARIAAAYSRFER